MLKKRGKPYGEWLIHDAWFEYRGQAANKDQIHKAAWLEDAIALTSSFVTGVHSKARHRCNDGATVAIEFPIGLSESDFAAVHKAVFLN